MFAAAAANNGEKLPLPRESIPREIVASAEVCALRVISRIAL